MLLVVGHHAAMQPCAGRGELPTATPLPEVDGAYDGARRTGGASQPTIGPLVNTIGGCTL